MEWWMSGVVMEWSGGGVEWWWTERWRNEVVVE